METSNFDWMFTTDPVELAAVEAEAARVAAVEAQAIIDDKARVVAFEVARLATRCPKCLGVGTLEHFKHRAGGICYRCGGSGKR